MRELKLWSGLTYRQLERKAARGGAYLPHSTIAGALTRDRLPRQELLTAFVAACGCSPAVVAEWAAVRTALAMAASPGPQVASDAVSGPDDSPRHSVAQRSALSRRPDGVGVSRRGRRWRAGAVLLAVALVTMGGLAGEPVSSPEKAGSLLSSSHCPGPIVLGTYGLCAQELQRQLQRHGLDLPADGWFGPYTKMRVMAFQAFSGLPATSMDDQATRRALLAGRSARIPHWTSTQVERRLREVFSDKPTAAVNLARCLSYLDPLRIIADRYGVRRWGLFQFSDPELLELGASEATALDAEWNIQAAHTIWKRTKDFRNWKCRPATNNPQT